MGCGASTAAPQQPSGLAEKLAEEPKQPRRSCSSADIQRSSTVGLVPIAGGKEKEPCKHFAKYGNCKYGDKCKYKHEWHEPKKSPRPCRDFQKGYCKAGDHCRYSHEAPAEPNGASRKDSSPRAGRVSNNGFEDVLTVGPESVSLQITFAEAVEVLTSSKDNMQKELAFLRMQAKELLPEIQSMDLEERTASGGFKWQFRGKKSEARFYDFKEENNEEIEKAFQAWDKAGKSKKREDRRLQLAVADSSHKVTLDFHLMTQRSQKGAVRVIRRHEMPSKAEEECSSFFDDVLRLVGDACDKIESVNGRKASMGLTTIEDQELVDHETAIVESMRSVIEGFIQLTVLCNAGELLEKLTAVLGPNRAGRLGVEASGRKMRLQAVCKSLKLAFESKSYGKSLAPGESVWSHVRLLATTGKRFYGQSMIKIRSSMVSYKNDSIRMSRRHAFMLAGMMLNECSDDPDFIGQCKTQLKRILQDGLQIAMAGGGDLEAISAILSNTKALDVTGINMAQIREWCTSRLRSALNSKQPVRWTAELLSEMKKCRGVDIAIVLEPVKSQLIEKLCKAVGAGRALPEKVNQLAIFSHVLGTSFDEGLFAALKPLYDNAATREVVTEWLVAYCEHMKKDLPAFCMTSDQAECFDNLTEALSSFSGSGADTSRIKAAVIAAKLVPNLKNNHELCELFQKALLVLKTEARLPPGWDLEDLLTTEKFFKKEHVTDPFALTLFQELMDSTHQKRWTRDRAARGDGEKIADKFEVVHVTEIRNQESWENYDRRRQEIIRRCCPPGGKAEAPISDQQWQKWSGRVMTKDIGEKITNFCKLTPLDPRCNEFIFFHGARPHVADLIAENHFDISFASKDGMFGAGLYFAEASSKSDEYCFPNDRNEFPVILVRATLGRPNYVDTPKPYDDPGRRQMERGCMSGTYNSVIGDRIKVSGTYREFVLYDHFQAYPHFILWYKRV